MNAPLSKPPTKDSPAQPPPAQPPPDQPPAGKPTEPDDVDAPSDSRAFAPLSNPTYRAFWIASLVSNLGTWVHEVGAGWLMTSLDASPVMVSSVRVAIAAPMVVLAIPIGGITDRIEKRTLLITTTVFLLAVTAILSQVTLSEWITAPMLLALTFAVGVGMVGHILAWQSTIPELVPREQLSRAISLGSLSFNLARSVGPAIGGLLIAVVGTWSAFGFNAISFGCVLAVLIMWRPTKTLRGPRQDFWASIATGLRFCWATLPIRSSLTNLALFVIPGSCLWALLPLFVRQTLGWDSRGFGVLVALLGMGAVCAAGMLHHVQRRLGFDRTVASAMALFAVAIFAIGTFPHPAVVIVAIFMMGIGWMMTLTTLNSTTQLHLPSDIRGRGMSLHVTTMSLSMVIGAFLWGRIADQVGIGSTYQAAGAASLVASLISLRLKLR